MVKTKQKDAVIELYGANEIVEWSGVIGNPIGSTFEVMVQIKTYFNWSSGKDSALALYHILQNPDFKVLHLLTSVNRFHDRVSMHGLRRELLLRQVASIGMPFSTIELPEEPSMDEYNNAMKAKVTGLRDAGFEAAAFGDIFLEDLRVYREQQLAPFNIRAIFPIWKRDTRELLLEFIKLKFKAITVCVNANLLDSSFAGRILDETFMNDLPPNVDPCGENGEFHTFCFDGPIFNQPVQFKQGEIVYREYKSPNSDTSMGFYFKDLLPVPE